MIVRAGIEHVELLSKLGAETFISSHKDSAPLHEIAMYVKETYNSDAIKNDLANPQIIYHIIKHENNVVGFSKMELDVKHPAIEIINVSKMDQIYLLNSFQRLKLGAKLLRYNVEYSKTYRQDGM